MCCGYFLQHEAEFAAFWGGAGNRCDPPTCQRPPHPSPDTHTHSNSFQHVEEEFCSSVLSHDQNKRGLFSPDFNPQYIPQTYSDNWSDIRQPQALNDPDFV